MTVLILEGDYEPEVKEQALCMLANIADGCTAKQFIMENEDILKKITNYMVGAYFVPIPMKMRMVEVELC